MMVHVPPWSSAAEDPVYLSHGNGVADDYALFLALQRYLPSNSNDAVPEEQLDTVDAHTCDDFRMFDFKVRKCTRGRSHDWTECPFAHPGEKARRRDPRRFHYSGAACPDFRKGNCRRGDACEYAHGVFECWLHPARYRTQPCKDGVRCTRRVCFFAHSPDQLRVVSPRSESPLSGSPPLSPLAFNETVSSMRKLHLGSSLLSPRVNLTLPGHVSNSNTPTRPGIGYFEEWDIEDENLERVESGRDLRAKMFEKLSKENPLDRADPDPDLGWVSELVK